MHIIWLFLSLTAAMLSTYQASVKTELKYQVMCDYIWTLKAPTRIKCIYTTLWKNYYKIINMYRGILFLFWLYSSNLLSSVGEFISTSQSTQCFDHPTWKISINSNPCWITLFSCAVAKEIASDVTMVVFFLTITKRKVLLYWLC